MNEIEELRTRFSVGIRTWKISSHPEGGWLIAAQIVPEEGMQYAGGFASQVARVMEAAGQQQMTQGEDTLVLWAKTNEDKQRLLSLGKFV